MHTITARRLTALIRGLPREAAVWREELDAQDDGEPVRVDHPNKGRVVNSLADLGGWLTTT